MRRICFISSVIGTHRLELISIPWNFDSKPCCWPLNIPELLVFDNQMNHWRLYSNSTKSIFPLLILLRIWIILWRIQILFVILSFSAIKCLSICLFVIWWEYFNIFPHSDSVWRTHSCLEQNSLLFSAWLSVVMFTIIFYHCGIFRFLFNLFPFNLWKTMYSLLRIRHNMQVSYFTTMEVIDGSLP
jgi:hypothetical protein